MMLKRILALFLSVFIAFTFVSCAPDQQLEDGLFKIADAKGITDTPDDSNVNFGSNEENGDVDNSETDEKEENVSSGENLILNTSSKKIHLSTECTYAQSMSEANKRIETKEKLQEYLENGYSVCSNCNKKYGEGN